MFCCIVLPQQRSPGTCMRNNTSDEFSLQQQCQARRVVRGSQACYPRAKGCNIATGEHTQRHWGWRPYGILICRWHRRWIQDSVVVNGSGRCSRVRRLRGLNVTP